MDLISWLNRTFQTNILSAPLAAMAGGAEGVSVVHSMAVQGEASPEEALPAATMAPEDTSVAEPEEQPTTLPDIEAIKRVLEQYAAQTDAHFEAETNASRQEDPEGKPIVRLANTLIQLAIRERASDIHIEWMPRYVRVRYRIDGVLQEARPMPHYLYSPLIHRYKILAGIDMATHRGQPQEGRVPIRYQGNDYNIRVHSQPTQNGEHLAFHIDSRNDIQLGFAELGFTPSMQAQLERLTGRSSGLLLVAGPSGSGKTTLQYSILNHCNTVGVHTATVETRATHTLSGTTQIVVDSAEGGTLASTLREALLNDVDVVGVSDIGDKATVQAALDAAAGSLVIATLRGDSALSTLVRLTSMGFDPGLIAETVCGVIGLRLVRKVCGYCKETYAIPGRDMRGFGDTLEDPEAEVALARGTGCAYCHQTGYRGRVGLYELFRWDPTLVKLFTERASLAHLQEAAFQNEQMRDLRADGLVKVLAQMTTPEEVLRACD